MNQWQVAEGEELPLKQNEIKLEGHSIQARIYAEEPYNSFLPAAGNLQYLNYPPVSEDVRVETGVRQGDDVSVHYDPMIAKLVVWSKTRSDAFVKLKNNLASFHVRNIDLLRSTKLFLYLSSNMLRYVSWHLYYLIQ